MMTKQLPEPQSDAPAKRIWRLWKWIGLTLYAAVLLFSRWLPSLIVAVGYLYGIVVIANLLFHLFRYLKNRFFWRVRNRLIGSFVFVGLIPLLLFSGGVFLSGFVLFGQLAGRYLDNSLIELEHQITAINTELGGRLSPSMTEAKFDDLTSSVFADHAVQFSHLAARLLRRNSEGEFDLMFPYDPARLEKTTSRYPGKAWLSGMPSFEGPVVDGGTLLMISLQPLPKSDKVYLAVSAPVDRSTEDRLQREKSIYFALIGVGRTNVVINRSSVQVTVKSDDPESSRQDTRELNLLESRRLSDPRRMVTWYVTIDGKEYSTGKTGHGGVAILHVPLGTVYQYSVGKSDVQGEVLLKIIYVLGGMFVLAELVSLVIGFVISRRITRSVHDMYQGTLALQKGDLQHRIPVRRKDQLGLLAHSFNQMSASISRLLEEVSEKKRLEQELEIAREVQATLFPKQLPHPRGMAIFGGCEPARVVSGDYYDFIVEDEARLDIVVADISGKGISAALLMANLQAAMRNQLLSIKHDSPEDIENSLAEVVTQLNQQIYLNSPAEKYATLFLSRYDAETRRLSYCNAGHLPPILLEGQGVQMLEPTGMVVGLFPNASYQAKSVEMSPGSTLAIFTDGVTEAVNGTDEEFGDERLLEALRGSRARTPEGIYKFVIEKIRAWQGDLPQHDDITLIIAKAG
jgi:sigma-B regulation protein RsbU (phosphoserine phosphatase)